MIGPVVATWSRRAGDGPPRALGQADRPFTLDRRSAESVINSFAIIEAHVEGARVVLVSFPDTAEKEGLPEAVAVWKDGFARVKDRYDLVRKTVIATYRDGQPRDIFESDFAMLTALDDASATLLERAKQVLVARGLPPELAIEVPLYPDTFAASGEAGPGIQPEEGLSTAQWLGLGGVAAALAAGLGLAFFG